MPQVIVKQITDRKMVHRTGKTKFSGCQCFKDCTCNEDFVSAPYNYYTITRRMETKKQKTTHHANLEDAEKRWEFINALTK